MKVSVLGSLRTNNFEDLLVADKIGLLWKKALEQLNELEPGILYGIYHHYAGDFKEDYTLSIASSHTVTVDTLEIPSEVGCYQLFKVNIYRPNGVFETWQEIWQQEEKGLLHRAYTLDYEQYEPDGSVTIHIAVKKGG